MNTQTNPDQTRELTIDEARALPGMLGRIAPAVHHNSVGQIAERYLKGTPR